LFFFFYHNLKILFFIFMGSIGDPQLFNFVGGFFANGW